MDTREWVDLERLCEEARNETGVKRFTFVSNGREEWDTAIIIQNVPTYKNGQHIRYEGASERLYDELRKVAKAGDGRYWINLYVDSLRNNDALDRVVHGDSLNDHE